MDATAPQRYARQTALKEIGTSGQEKLAGATAVILGLGALGSNSANMLARAGVGTLRLVDRDFVDWTNLQRQSLYEEADAAAALPKAAAAAAHLQRINSAIRCETVVEDINATNIERLIAGATVVVDGLDNFHTRALLNQACVKHGIPWVHGACLGTCGNAATIIPGRTACLACLLPEVGTATTPPLTCETVGVLGPVAMMVAAWQSTEAIKLIVGASVAISRGLTHIDPWHGDICAVPAARVPNCRVCGEREFDLLDRPARLASASLCGRDAVQIVPPLGAAFDFELLRTTLEQLFPIERNPYLLRFHAEGHDIAVFSDGRAMVFGTMDPERALRLYCKYIGG
jgi:adenylyltransferase/sulfurtransferase